LSNIPAVVRFISYEPALGPVRLPTSGPLPDWVISGGESGPRARPIKRKWVRNIILDCNRFSVAVFHKQWGTYAHNPLVTKHGLTIGEAKARDPHPGGKGGSLIDGQLVQEFPVPRRRIVSSAA
jgi:protein gp37